MGVLMEKITVDKSLFELSDLVYYVDTDDNVVSANEAFLVAADCKNETEIIGKSTFQLPWGHCTPHYTANNYIVIRKKKILCCIEPAGIPSNKELHCLSIKSPVISSCDQVIGVKGVSIPILPSSINELLNKFVFVANHFKLALNSPLMISIMSQIGRLELTNHKAIKEKKSFDYIHVTFSLREAQCLHYLFNNYSANETAKRLFISRKTVEFHLANIKLKLNCDTKSLSKKAIDYGFIDLMFMRF